MASSVIGFLFLFIYYAKDKVKIQSHCMYSEENWEMKIKHDS